MEGKQKLAQKEEKPLANNILNKPFQVDNNKSHRELQHPTWWKENSNLLNEGKKSYFQNDIPHQDTIQVHFQGTQVPHHEFVDKTGVDVIIGEMYFHLEDKEQVKEGALIIF